jgi:hypothetical protein
MPRYVAKEHLYEQDENGEDYRLLVPAGDPVSDEQFALLGLKKSDRRVERAEDVEPADGEG